MVHADVKRWSVLVTEVGHRGFRKDRWLLLSAKFESVIYVTVVDICGATPSLWKKVVLEERSNTSGDKAKVDMKT